MLRYSLKSQNADVNKYKSWRYLLYFLMPTVLTLLLSWNFLFVSVAEKQIESLLSNSPPVAMPDVIFIDAPYNTYFFGNLIRNDFDP